MAKTFSIRGGGPGRGTPNTSIIGGLGIGDVNRTQGGKAENRSVQEFLKGTYPAFQHTIVDPGGDWVISGDGIYTNEGLSNVCAHASRELDSPISGDYTLRVKFRRGSKTHQNAFFWFGLGEEADCWWSGLVADYDYNYVRSYQGGSPNPYLTCGGAVDGTNSISTSNLSHSLDTDYFIEMKRVGAQIQQRVYSDPDFSVQVGSLIAHTLTSTDTMNYLMLGMNYGAGAAYIVDITVEEISLTV
jgi:hypothetical protein